jgi:hypothetical protein
MIQHVLPLGALEREGMSYWQELTSAKDRLVEVLARRGIDGRYLSFGGPGESAQRQPSVPTDARSEFLANRAMGDWAEDILANSISDAQPAWTVSHYGNAQRIAAGENGFKEFYLSVMEEVRLYGKRPDILVFDKALGVSGDITSLSVQEADEIVPKALAAIEVRSSKFEALRYMRVRREDKTAGGTASRQTPSFTVKVEDLRIVYRWLQRYKIPQTYCQVFFDVAYAISFLEIFGVIGSGQGFVIEKPAKSQEKATIMIPITSGTCIGTFSELPKFEVRERVTRLGRHDAYVVPTGGSLQIDPQSLETVLIP